MPELNLSDIKEPDFPKADKKAQKEEAFLISDMERKHTMDGTVHWWKRILLGVSFFIIIIIIVIRIYALVMPESWQWLSPEQTFKIDEFFVHGTIGAIIASYLGKYFREEKRKE